MKKRILALLLASLTLCASLAACADKDQGGETNPTTSAVKQSESADTTAAPETEPKYLDRVPEDLRYDGKQVTILQRSAKVNEMFSEGVTGEIINDAIYARNRAVEERLGITLNFADVEGTYKTYSTFTSAITNSVNAQDDAYQIIANYAYYGAALCTQGVYTNLLAVEHLDLDQPWWNQDYREEATIQNKLYYIVGDITTSAIDRLTVTYLNRDLAEDYYPGVDFYAVAREGKWTLDYQLTLAKDAYRDLNGDGQTDAKDAYGLTVGCQSIPIDALMAAFEITATRRNAAGQIEAALNTEHNLEAAERMHALYYNSDGVTTVANWSEGRKKFTAEETVFYYDMLNFTSAALREVKFSYGILPLPKYSEAQTAYHTTPHDEYSTLSVPVTVSDASMVGAVLEVMGAESYRGVRPVIFETAYKMKYLGDEVTAQMFDYILEGAVYDFGYIFSNSINNPVHVIRNYVRYNETGLASKIAANSKLTEKKLESFLKMFNDLP